MGPSDSPSEPLGSLGRFMVSAGFQVSAGLCCLLARKSAPPRPRPGPAPAAGACPNPGAPGGPGAVRRRPPWRIKPLATCRAAPPCAAVRGPPCPRRPRPRSHSLCRLCARPRHPRAPSPASTARAPGLADMGSRSRARWAAGALGCFGLLCAVLGIVMIAAVPSIIKQQILKVGAGRRRGARGRRAPRRPGAPEHRGHPSAQRRGRRSVQRPSTPSDPGRGWGPRGHLGSLLEARVGEP